jgi:hypothetical protein
VSGLRDWREVERELRRLGFAVEKRGRAKHPGVYDAEGHRVYTLSGSAGARNRAINAQVADMRRLGILPRQDGSVRAATPTNGGTR